VSLDSETSVLLAGGCESSSLTVLMNRVTDPVDTRIVTDLGVGRIDKDDLIVLHGSILVNPV
jgi:hypothetical protein